ncbi:hypothetical protein E2C01_034476 [Portunus trituberculatus]|uniref:Uncharacterized protein n=1 Tax=Portunus trituberculatus TaxID=210409 RepID=A0A5B7F2Y2_PORTR|nr:hypothetical protein [Portunus trituberculatus]
MDRATTYQPRKAGSCKLKYSRNRFLGQEEPSKPVSEPVPRRIGRARLVNTNYQRLGTANALLDEYQRAGGSETGIHQPAELVPESFFSGESVEHG